MAISGRRYQVPFTTLYNHVKKPLLRIGAGAPTVLTVNEEREIVLSLQALQEIGFGSTRDLVGIVICDYDYFTKQPYCPNPFCKRVPGKDWWGLFLKRWHSELTERKPQHLSTHRALSHQK